MLGFPWADAIGAVGVAVIILYAAFRIGREAFDELIDTGLDPNTLTLMRETILSVPGVIDVHELRTRRMGSQLLADMHIHVNPLISVSEGHHIGDHVMQVLEEKFKALSDVVVHIDPEDDFEMPNPSGLPLRLEIEEAVQKTLVSNNFGSRSFATGNFSLVLHYVGGSVTGEVVVALPSGKSAEAMKDESEALSKKLVEETPLSDVRILYRG